MVINVRIKKQIYKRYSVWNVVIGSQVNTYFKSKEKLAEVSSPSNPTDQLSHINNNLVYALSNVS